MSAEEKHRELLLRDEQELRRSREEEAAQSQIETGRRLQLQRCKDEAKRSETSATQKPSEAEQQSTKPGDKEVAYVQQSVSAAATTLSDISTGARGTTAQAGATSAATEDAGAKIAAIEIPEQPAAIADIADATKVSGATISDPASGVAAEAEVKGAAAAPSRRPYMEAAKGPDAPGPQGAVRSHSEAVVGAPTGDAAGLQAAHSNGCSEPPGAEQGLEGVTARVAEENTDSADDVQMLSALLERLEVSSPHFCKNT